MTDEFRDAVFGQVVRLLFRKRLLKFPDEIDPTLWKQCIRTDTTTDSTASGTQNAPAGSSDCIADDVNDNEEKVQKQNSGDSSTHDSREKQYLGDSSHENTTDVVLVDWYGPGDQEV